MNLPTIKFRAMFSDGVLEVEAPEYEPPNYPFGWECEACGRPHVFRQENGDYECQKCDHVQGLGRKL